MAKALSALVWARSRVLTTSVKTWPSLPEARVKAGVRSALPLTVAMVEPRTDWASVEAAATCDLALATMP